MVITGKVDTPGSEFCFKEDTFHLKVKAVSGSRINKGHKICHQYLTLPDSENLYVCMYVCMYAYVILYLTLGTQM
jgi:hypothetical protein